MPHLVGSIAWNSHGWRAAPEDADRTATGHANVRLGYIGNECLNLAMDPTTIADGWKYGAVEKFESKTRFTDGSLIFLWSRSPKWRKARIVGVLARVQRLGTLRKQWPTSVGPLAFNLRIPAVAGLAILFAQPVRVDPDRHLREGDKTKKGPGQACGCYIDDASAQQILSDAAKDDSSALALLRLLDWQPIRP